jgi:cytochrome c biogenesis protein ResB
LGRGQAEDISLGEKNLKLAYALKSLPLGFSVKLKEFRMGKYDGTENPSSYESLVQVQDKTPAESGEHLIAMNEPLHQGKYKIFQASYQLNQDGPDWSVLAVAYDPGINIKYLGSLILVLGIVIIFYFRKAYMGIPIGERIREKLKAPSYSNPGLVEEAR